MSFVPCVLWQIRIAQTSLTFQFIYFIYQEFNLQNMRIAVSSISFTAATVSQALFDTKSAVASAVDMAFESKTEHLDANTSIFHNKECSFVTSFKLRGQPADSGILGCSDPDYICVEDELSSLGGRCAPRAVAGRELQNTPACTSKCTGTDACKGVPPAVLANIGANSCCGYKACQGITGERMSCLRDNCFHCTLSIISCVVLLSQTDTTVTIGPNSCVGMKACYKIKNGKCIPCVAVESTVFFFQLSC
jgi:hypothetical protein